MNCLPGLKLRDLYFGLANFLLVEFDLFLNPNHLKIRIGRLDPRLFILTASNQFQLMLKRWHFVFVLINLILPTSNDLLVVLSCGLLGLLSVGGFSDTFRFLRLLWRLLCVVIVLLPDDCLLARAITHFLVIIL